MIPENYLNMKYPSPEIFKDKFVGESAIIIATGVSTKRLIQYRNKLCTKFGVVIGLNRASDDFEKQMTHHLIVEKKPIDIYSDMAKNPKRYRKDLPRILNFKGLHRYPKYLNIIKVGRTKFDGNPDIRKYNNNNNEGLLSGPLGKLGFSLGTVSLQAIHLASIMGCNNIYLSGVDLIFSEKFDHYYNDRAYRNGKPGPNKSPITKVTKNGKIYETTTHFRDSAEYLDKVINTMCRPVGIEVYTFSDSLLTAPMQVDIDKFFGEP